jgi:hypothetical protein
MVSGVVYRLFDLIELPTERIEGGDERLEQATRNGVSLPANGVYRPEQRGGIKRFPSNNRMIRLYPSHLRHIF